VRDNSTEELTSRERELVGFSNRSHDADQSAISWRLYFRIAESEATFNGVKNLTSNTSSAYMYSCASREKRSAVKILKSRGFSMILEVSRKERCGRRKR